MTDAPEHGARFEIARQGVTDAGATYVIAVFDAAAKYEAHVTVRSDSVDTRWTTEPPRWIADTAHGFMKTLQKNHVADASWPSRLVRWRSERS